MEIKKIKLDNFYGIDEHFERFGTEAQCLKFIEDQIYPNGKPVCPKCQNDRLLYIVKSKKTRMYKCPCGASHSPLSQTIFSGSSTPLRKWFLIMYHFTQFYQVPSTELARKVGLPQPTVYRILQKLRIALKNMNDDVLLGENGNHVEMDLAFASIKIEKNSRVRKNWNIYKKKILELSKGPDGIFESTGKSGRRTEEQEIIRRAALKEFHKTEPYGKSHAAIFGMQERGGRLILKKVGASSESGSARRLLSTAIQHISRDAYVHIDDHASYSAIKLLFDKPMIVNHSDKKYWEIDQDTEIEKYTNTIEAVFSVLKPMLKRHRRISFKHLDKYLLQFTFRWNHRNALPIDCTNDFLPFLIQKKQKMEEVGDRFINWTDAAEAA